MKNTALKINVLAMVMGLSLTAGAGMNNFAESVTGSRSFVVSEGTVHGGGGDTLNGDLIEKYGGHSVDELPQFKAAVARVAQFFPLMATLEYSLIREKNVFLIPKNFKQLPIEMNDLNFDTQAPCYQKTEEIFCDSTRLEQMNPDQLRELFVHEIFVNRMIRYNRTMAAVRLITGVVINPNATVQQASDTLRRSGMEYSTQERSPLSGMASFDYLNRTQYQALEKYRGQILKAGLNACNNSPKDGPFYAMYMLLGEQGNEQLTIPNHIIPTPQQVGATKYYLAMSVIGYGWLKDVYLNAKLHASTPDQFNELLLTETCKLLRKTAN